jgi:hypothetical protein
MKLRREELDELRSILAIRRENTQTIGLLEMEKGRLVAQSLANEAQYNSLQHRLMEKYGENLEIDPDTGKVKIKKETNEGLKKV